MLDDHDRRLFILCFSQLKQTILNIGTDNRCDVHQMILGIREKKDGWFHLYCPGGIACDDEGEVYGEMVRELDVLNIYVV